MSTETSILTITTIELDETFSKESAKLNTNGALNTYEDIDIIKRISKGRFPVYLASSKDNNQKYALKIFGDTFNNSEKYYQNEIRFAALSHPNIANIVHHEKNKVFKQKGILMRVTYTLSEYACHGDFYDFVTNHKNDIDDKLARTYFRQLIDGLEYLHGIGITHMDIKLENLLLDADFNLKIIDFDSSYVSSDDKIMGRGTKCYRGPELYLSNSRELDNPSAADIYSAGILLFVLKTGGVYPHMENNTFRGINFTELMCKDQNKFWVKHCQIQGKQKSFFDSNFRELFQKMVDSDPNQRLNIRKIKQSQWYNGPVYTREELSVKMKAILRC